MASFTRICLIGPECTGKSTLAQRLAEHFGVPWVPEFAREHALERGNLLTFDDVELIARGQMANEDRFSSARILDTDLISTVVYSRHYYGRVPDWVAEEARRRRADLYLLMDTDVPWQSDSARDRGGEGREDLFDEFRRALDEFETRWTVISGKSDERFQNAVSEIALLKA
jgi:NadR type nicotinamide-nucleotide adenylyltransferase